MSYFQTFFINVLQNSVSILMLRFKCFFSLRKICYLFGYCFCFCFPRSFNLCLFFFSLPYLVLSNLFLCLLGDNSSLFSKSLIQITICLTAFIVVFNLTVVFLSGLSVSSNVKFFLRCGSLFWLHGFSVLLNLVFRTETSFSKFLLFWKELYFQWQKRQERGEAVASNCPQILPHFELFIYNLLAVCSSSHADQCLYCQKWRRVTILAQVYTFSTQMKEE